LYYNKPLRCFSNFSKRKGKDENKEDNNRRNKAEKEIEELRNQKIP
jgi:hypothetical protein